jgi:hypothetical protein
MQTDRRVLCADFARYFLVSRKPSVQIAYLADKYHPIDTQLVYTRLQAPGAGRWQVGGF